MFSLKKASELVGVSKVALQHKIKQGKLSARKNNKGHYEVDYAELLRVYPEIDNKVIDNKVIEVNETNHQNFAISDNVLIEKLKAELNAKEIIEQRLLDEIDEKKKSIIDYQKKLESSECERRATQEKLTLLLTDQSSSKAKKKGLLGRIFG